MDWTEAGKVEEISPGFHIRGEGRKRYVLALIDGSLFAFDAICPHAGGPMHLAETHGTTISCPLHAWRFDLANGGCELHGYRPLAMHPVRVENGVVYVALPASAAVPVETASATQP